MLPKQHRLPSFEMSRLMRSGKRTSTPLLQLIMTKTNLPFSRFAFVVSTKIDKRATARNRMKRLLREAIHHRLSDIPTGWDMAIFVRKNMSTLSLAEVEQMITMLLNQAKILVVPLSSVSSPTRSGIHDDGFPPEFTPCFDTGRE